MDKPLFQVVESCDKVKSYPSRSLCRANLGPVRSSTKDDDLAQLTRGELILYASIFDPSVNWDNTDDKRLCEIINNHLPTQIWYQKQEQYMASLTDYEMEIIHNYTHKGDKILNTCIRYGINQGIEMLKKMNRNYNYVFSKALAIGVTEADLSDEGREYLKDIYDDDFDELLMSYDSNYFKPEVTKNGLENVIGILNKIINESPTVDREFKVFRGMKIKSSDLFQDKIITPKGFTSVSTDMMVAGIYSTELNERQGGTMTIFTVPKDSHILSIQNVSQYKDEFELLLSSQIKFRVDGCRETSMALLQREWNRRTQCLDRLDRIDLCYMTIINE